MTNEKAIEWLMHYITKDCENCDGVQNFGCDSKCFSLRALDIAIEALEKQTAKKPIEIKGMTTCPNCNCDRIFLDRFYRKENCCPVCGQRIDWNGYRSDYE